MMTNSAGCVYRIDGQNRICFVNDSWSAFARDNHGAHLLPENVLRTCIWDYVTGLGTRYIYVKVLDYVRETREPLSFDLRCDSPALSRTLKMTVTPIEEGGVQFESLVLSETQRPAIELLDVVTARDSRIVPLCGWCMQAQTSQLRWASLEEAAHRIDRSEAGPLPELVHTVCPACHYHLREMMPVPSAAPSSDW